MQNNFIFEIAKIVGESSEEDFRRYCDSPDSFFNDYGHLRDSYKEYKTKRSEKWGAILREIRLWKDLNLRYMYARIMQLAQDYKGNYEYFEAVTDYGTYVVPDRATLLNKLLHLSREILFEIYPKIEQSLSYEPDTLRVDDSVIRGRIDWNTTLENTVRKSQKFPTSFVSLVPTQEFNTPENILLLVSLFWIKNNSLHLMRYYMPDELSKNELSKLNQIFTTADGILEHTILRLVQDNANHISEIGHGHGKVFELISHVTERIHLGVVNHSSYSQLLDWVKKYLSFNTERFARNLVNFRIERTRDVDTMYELWILFEIMRHLDSKFDMRYQPIIDAKNKFCGFDISINGKKFKLKYQQSYSGQVHERIEPDYTMEKNDDEIPMILDAKNWMHEKTAAKDKMIVYLVEMSSKNPAKGILFFPNNTHLPENKTMPYFERAVTVGSIRWGLITCVIRPSTNSDVQAQNKIVLDKISELFVEI